MKRQMLCIGPSFNSLNILMRWWTSTASWEPSCRQRISRQERPEALGRPPLTGPTRGLGCEDGSVIKLCKPDEGRRNLLEGAYKIDTPDEAAGSRDGRG